MLTNLLGLAVAAAITENIVFGRGLEHGMQAQVQPKPGELLRMGFAAAIYTTIAGGCGWLGRYASENLVEVLSWTRPALYVAVYGVAIILLMVIISYCKALTKASDAKIATKLVYGFVPLGTLFVVGNAGMGPAQSLVYGLGAGLGFLLALMLWHGLQQRLEHSDLPKVFRGMPATLLTLGMISLAVYGLLGHPLVA